MERNRVKAASQFSGSILTVFLLILLQHGELRNILNKNHSLLPKTRAIREMKEIHTIKTLQHSPTLGFRNTFANWVFIRFLLYFGDDEARNVDSYEDSHTFFEAIIQHDPYFRKFYVFLSGSVTNYAGEPDKSVAIMQQGLESLSPNQPGDSYYVWRYKAADELLFLAKGKDAEHSYDMAAEWAAQSKDIDGEFMSHLSRQTAQFLADNPDSKLAQINAWSSILTTALDAKTRNRAITKIRELGGNVVLGSDGRLQIKYAQVEKPAGEEEPDS